MRALCGGWRKKSRLDDPGVAFAYELACARGLEVEDVLAMSTDEVDEWNEYRRRHGFPIDRLVWVVANVGSAICQSIPWGPKIEPKDFVPRFRRASVNLAVLISQLSALPGAKIRKRPKRDGSR